MLETIQPQVMDGRRARDFSPKRGHIYLISSGMMTENTLSNVFAQEFLAHEKSQRILRRLLRSRFACRQAEGDAPRAE